MNAVLRQDRRAVLTVASIIIVNALLYFLSHNQTYVHIDAIAHVNKGRGLFDSYTPGLLQLGSIWLPLQHILIAPLAWFDVLWSTGLAGSVISAACFVASGGFLFATAYRISGAKAAGWLAFFFFALNPRLIYLFTTPMTEPLMIAFAAGLTYFLISWQHTERWQPLAWAALMAFCGTLTRYEGWAIGAASVGLVFLLAYERRVITTILYAGAFVTGPMLWMIYNMFYFDDPLAFTYGRGSAKDYSLQHFLQTGRPYATAGSWTDSLSAYFSNVAYCINPIVMWLAIAGIVLSWLVVNRYVRRVNMVLFTMTAVPFAFYVYNLYSNTVPIIMPGLLENDPDGVINVRYGMGMAATLPVYAALLLQFVFTMAERHRTVAFVFLAPLFFPDPTPAASQEAIGTQFTRNLFYTEGIRNQSYWMPPFLQVGDRLKAEIEQSGDQESFVLTNSRIVHVVVWRTAIPMRRFINEMNEDRWDQNLNAIDPGIRWVIIEEGDQLWNAQSWYLKKYFVEVDAAQLKSTKPVRLYRRP